MPIQNIKIDLNKTITHVKPEQKLNKLLVTVTEH